MLAVSNVLSAYLCDPSAALRFIGLRLSLTQRRGEPQRYAEKSFEEKPLRGVNSLTQVLRLDLKLLHLLLVPCLQFIHAGDEASFLVTQVVADAEDLRA